MCVAQVIQYTCIWIMRSLRWCSVYLCGSSLPYQGDAMHLQCPPTKHHVSCLPSYVQYGGVIELQNHARAHIHVHTAHTHSSYTRTHVIYALTHTRGTTHSLTLAHSTFAVNLCAARPLNIAPAHLRPEARSRWLLSMHVCAVRRKNQQPHAM